MSEIPEDIMAKAETVYDVLETTNPHYQGSQAEWLDIMEERDATRNAKLDELARLGQEFDEMSEIPEEYLAKAEAALHGITFYSRPEYSSALVRVASALMEAEARGRKHGPMLCTSCGTVCSTDECDCTRMGMESLSMRVNYIAHLRNELDLADEKLARALMEAVEAERERCARGAAIAIATAIRDRRGKNE
ncbi:MAG: hypothetical protein ACK5X3_23855 [Pseudomonadota bacterium]